MKGLRSILLCLLAAIIFIPAALPALAADTAGLNGVAVPEAGSDRYYLDLGEVLTPEFEAEIVSYNKDSKNLGEIVIVTVKSLGGAALYDYGVAIFDRWEIGTKENRKGVLLLMSVEDDTYFAYAGEGVSAKFASGVMEQLLAAQVDPDFTAKSYETAARKFLTAAGQTLKGTDTAGGASSSEAPAEKGSGGIGGAIWGFFKVLLIIVGIVLLLGIAFVVAVNLRTRQRRNARRNHPQGRRRPASDHSRADDSRQHRQHGDDLEEEEPAPTEEFEDFFGD